MAKKIEYLYGFAAVEGALTAGRRERVRLLVKEGNKNPRMKPLLHLARQLKLPFQSVGADQLFKLSGSKTNQGVVLETSPLVPYDLEDLGPSAEGNKQLLIALDQVEDPQNLGAIVRTAAFLGASGVLQTKAHAAAMSPAASKASAGALETFPVVEVGNLSETLNRLKNDGYWILGSTLSESSQQLSQAMQADKIVLVLGNEGAGIRQLTAKRCDQLIQIPGSGKVESLNVSASAAILMHHLLWR